MLTKDSLRAQFAKEWEKHYKTKALEEHGFSRKKCSKCGKGFWSVGEKQDRDDDKPAASKTGPRALGA